MKKAIFLFTLCLLVSTNNLIAQPTEYKFGNVSKDELLMTSYATDPSAAAVILYKSGKTDCTYNMEFNYISTDYTYRIKILKPEGMKYSKIKINYNNSKGFKNGKEKITTIDAVSYNLENEEIITTHLSKKDIKFNHSEGFVDITIPNAKEGSVIEFKYTVASKAGKTDPYRFTENNPWIIQEAIPVQYAEYEALYPKYMFKECEVSDSSYNIRIESEIIRMTRRGFLLNSKPEDRPYVIGGATPYIKLTAKTNTIPALIDNTENQPLTLYFNLNQISRLYYRNPQNDPTGLY